MPTTNAVANPFILMMNPQDVLTAIERSDRLEHLQRRVCRPLDKPLLPKRIAAELSDFDRAIDDEPPEAEAQADAEPDLAA